MAARQLELRVANRRCAHEAAAIERGVRRQAGIVDLKISFTPSGAHHVALGGLIFAGAAMGFIRGGIGWNSGYVSPRPSMR